jgi:long-chain acyl-CoA synthetase
MTGSKFVSVVDMWQHRVGSTPDGEAFQFRRDGAWVSLTWGDADGRIRDITAALVNSGIGVGDRVAILSATRVEWILVDLAVLCAGAATTTLYPSTTDAEIGHILRDSGARAVFCDTRAQADRVRAIAPNLLIVVFDDDRPEVSLRAMEERGRAFLGLYAEAVDARARAITGDSLATLIYTSGTTGRPKGVMLTHDAWVYEAEAIDALGLLSPVDRQYLFLPLAHVFAKVLQVLGIRLGMPTTLDADIERVESNLREVQPTWMAAVPRVFEKVRERVETEGRRDRVRAAVFDWAIGVGRRVSALKLAHERVPTRLRLAHVLADRMVFRKVKAGFGGKMRFLISGSAPLAPELASFFHACDLLILEGWGLTESAAATTVNTPEDVVFGSVGRPLAGTELRIAPDGEILIRGRGLMRGYHQQEADTAAALIDGWLHTGDIGVILPSGHLKITDRKKDIIVTAGGKNIAPQGIEEQLRRLCLLASQVVVHGDRRPYCIALVSLAPEAAGKWARAGGMRYTSVDDLAAHPDTKLRILEDVEIVNRGLNPWEQIKDIVVLPIDPSVENGLLTPSLKLRRREIESRFAEMIAMAYAIRPHRTDRIPS